MNNIFFALFAVLTLFISMVGGLLPQRLRTYQYMCLFMEILSCYIFFSPLGQPSVLAYWHLAKYFWLLLPFYGTIKETAVISYGKTKKIQNQTYG